MALEIAELDYHRTSREQRNIAWRCASRADSWCVLFGERKGLIEHFSRIQDYSSRKLHKVQNKKWFFWTLLYHPYQENGIAASNMIIHKYNEGCKGESLVWEASVKHCFLLNLIPGGWWTFKPLSNHQNGEHLMLSHVSDNNNNFL